MPKLLNQDLYFEFYQQFKWKIPPFFNIAQACLAHRSSANQIAIIEHISSSESKSYTYSDLDTASANLACQLQQMGVQAQTKVGILLPQSFSCALAYLALFRMGAVAVPLSHLFGVEAIEHRLRDSQASLLLTQASLVSVCEQLPADLSSTLRPWLINAEELLQTPAPNTDILLTPAESPALLIYTSGTTGLAKGAVIPHRALIGNLPGFLCSQNGFGMSQFNLEPAPSDAVFWSPADWAWTGGLMDALLPCLYFGRPIVAYSGRFQAQLALEILHQYQVTHSFLFPTALKAIVKEFPHISQQYALKLQAIMSAGEALGDTIFEYCQEQLGVTVNEMFGQTEINYVVGNCHHPQREAYGVGWDAVAGSMGRAIPGHRVAILDEYGQELPDGEVGEVCIHRYAPGGEPNPVFFLGYWQNPSATQDKFIGDWGRTGDLAYKDSNAYFWYQGRKDDMFKVAGYRVGPFEIENCLLKHPAVANVAIVPKPDLDRGNVVKAYIVLNMGYQPSDELIASLQSHVKNRLAPYEYPKDIEFIDNLPMTSTGKIQRNLLRKLNQ
ncbi:MAG: AMP-binding protein [Gammaproteobacteria bacterium]|nr:AMP-binding protein [Gammaproteobacteria bacterium]